MDTRKAALLEEIGEAESIAELEALDYGEYGTEDDVIGAVADRTDKLEKPTTVKTPVPAKAKKEKTDRKYRLLKFETAWATQSQVQALGKILAINFAVGDVVLESQIVAAVEEGAKSGLLRTRQGGERIWHYYKGDHNVGLLAHGNIEVIKDDAVSVSVGAPPATAKQEEIEASDVGEFQAAAFAE